MFPNVMNQKKNSVIFKNIFIKKINKKYISNNQDLWISKSLLHGKAR